MATRSLKVEIIGDASSLQRSLGSATTGAERFGASMKRVGRNMTIAGAAITGVAVIVGKRLVDSALAAEVSQAKLDTAFRNAGISAAKYKDEITKAQEAGVNLGFTNTETRDSLTKLVQGGDSVKQAMTDMALAQDYARATGRDLATATGSIVKVHQGLLRPLKELGISLPQVTDHMKALKEAHDKSKTAITATEKALAFQQDKLATGAQAIQLMTDKLHGQARAFAETSAGGIAIFNARLEALQETLGALLLPFIDRLVAALDRLLAALSSLSPQTQRLIVDIGLGVAAFGALMLVLGPIIAAIGTLLPVFVALASPIGILVVALVALGVALAAAVLWPDKLQGALERMGLSAKDAKQTVEALQNAFAAIRAVALTVWPSIQGIVMGAMKVIEGVLNIVSGILRGDWSQAWRGVKQVVSGVLQGLIGLITYFPRLVLAAALAIGKALIGGISSAAMAGWSAFFAWLGSLPAKIQGAFAGAGRWLYNVGVAIIQGLWDGLKAKWDAVAGWLSGLGSAIVGLKGPPSADAILLKGVGELIMQGLQTGMQQGWEAIKIMLAGFSPQIRDKFTQAMQAARDAIASSKGAVVSAMSALVDAALAAFDRLSSEIQTRSEKQLAALEARHAAAERAQATKDARDALAAAQAAAASVVQQQGETPEQFAARQKAAADAVIQAQQQLNQALYDQQVAALEARAANERAALDAKRERQRVALQNELDSAQRAYATGAINLEQYNQRVLAILNKYGIPMKKAATVLGAQLAQGLHDAFEGVQKAAKALANVIINELSKIRVIVNVELSVKNPKPAGKMAGGPVFGGTPYIVGEAGPELFVPSTSGRIVPNSRLSGSSGGGSVVVNVYNAGSVISERDLVDAVRDGLLAKQRQIGSLGFN